MVLREGPQHGQATFERLDEVAVAAVSTARGPRRSAPLTSALLLIDTLIDTCSLAHRCSDSAQPRKRPPRGARGVPCSTRRSSGRWPTTRRAASSSSTTTPKHYVFSNMFEVASASRAVREGRRRQEHGVRARGAPGRGHVGVADVRPRRVRPRDRRRGRGPPREARRAGGRRRTSRARSRLDGEPAGAPMGRIVAGRGHMALLPANAAYRFHADQPSA